jgi:spectinomycin phosphotransferase
MLEKLPLDDELLVAALRDDYGVRAASIAFLPIGYDAYAGVYRVQAEDGTLYFLKAKRNAFSKPILRVPRALRDQGIRQVVAPLPTRTGDVSVEIGEFTLLLYPFIEGEGYWGMPLSDAQWMEFGAVLKAIHASRLPAELLEQLPRETFVPNPSGADAFRQIHSEVLHREYTNPHEQELATFWRERHDEIGRILERAETLGRRLQSRPAEFVLCHSDIHLGNLMIDGEGNLFVVDWDQPMLAPKERDLLFVLASTEDKGAIETREGQLFFQGYGETEIDWLTLAYYRYDWAVQDIGSFGESTFLMDEVGDETKQTSAKWFRSLFAPGSTVEMAYTLDRYLSLP